MSHQRQATLGKIIFAPDWREGNPYQSLLAHALEEQGAEVGFLSDYSRGFPLARGLSRCGDALLHLHWPEAYFRDHAFLPHQWFSEWRYPLDRWMACRKRPLVATAHNLLPHTAAGRYSNRRNMCVTYRQAQRVVAHSKGAAEALQKTYDVDARAIRVIPHGDLNASAPALPSREESRSLLGIDPRTPVILMFGAASPYKGIEDVIQYWKKLEQAPLLAVVGRADSPSYAASLKTLAGSHPAIRLEVDRFLEDAELSRWQAAADACLFNYRAILTSGSAIQTRSLGIPVLFPSQLDLVDLGEPDPRVIRFDDLDGNFQTLMNQAIAMGPNHTAAARYRESIEWSRIATSHLAVYREAVTAY